MNQDATEEPGRDKTVNPAMRREVDATHGTEFKGTDPMKTVSVQDPEEGRNWPMVWAVVAIVCLVIAIYYVVA